MGVIFTAVFTWAITSFASNQKRRHKASSSRWAAAGSLHPRSLIQGGDKQVRMEMFKASCSYILPVSDGAHNNPVTPASRAHPSMTIHQERMCGCALSEGWLRHVLGTSLVRHRGQCPGEAGALQSRWIWLSLQAALAELEAAEAHILTWTCTAVVHPLNNCKGYLKKLFSMNNAHL